MLTIERLEHKITGAILPGFFVRNRVGKVLAIGAYSQDGGFVMPSRKRYAKDVDLCRALGKLTGLPVKWNLTFWCNHVTSHTRQALMCSVRKCGCRECRLRVRRAA